MMRRLLVVIFLILIFEPISAQNLKKFDKLVEKGEKQYEKGKYDKAAKAAQKLRKKSTKKLGAENNFVAIANLREAKYNFAQGQLSTFHAFVEQGLSISANLSESRPLEYAISLMEAGDLMLSYGNYRRAEGYFNESIPILKEHGYYEGKYQADLELKLAEIYMEQGFYQKALQLLSDYEDFYRKRVVKEVVNTDEVTGKSITKKLSKEEQNQRLEDFAQLLILKSNILRHQGKFLSSDSAFVYSEKWIKDKIGKRSRSYALVNLYFGQMLEENGVQKMPVSLYDQAMKSAKSSYGKAHPSTLKVYEVLTKGLINDGNLKQALSVYTEYENLVKKYYGKKTAYFGSLATISFWSAIRADEIKQIDSQAKKVYSGMSSIPDDHPKRMELNEMLAFAAAIDRKYQNAFNKIEDNLKIAEELYGASTPRYGMYKILQANYIIDYGDDFKEAQQIYNDWFFTVVDKEITAGHKDYVNILNHLAAMYEALDDYDKASALLEEALMATRVKYDNEDIEYGKELDKIARLQTKIGAYEEAAENVKLALDILDNFSDSKGIIHYIKALETQSKLFAIKGQYDDAESNIKQAQRLLSRKADRSSEYDETESAENLAWVYLKLGNYGKTDKILTGSIKDKELLFGNHTARLVGPLVDYGRLQLIRGDYTQTEQLARRALAISKDIFDEGSTKTVPALQLLGELYTNIGDYEKAQEFFAQAIDIQENQFGRQHFDVAVLIAQLALAHFYQGDERQMKLVEELLMESRNTVSSRFGANNPVYADILKDLAKVKIAQSQFDDAYAFLEQSETIWKSKAGKRNNINAADIHILRGDIHYLKREFNDAESEYRKGRRLYDKFFNDKHPEYVKTVSKLSKVYYMKNDIKSAKSSIEEALKNYNDYINNYFPALSEREKTKYWNTIRTDYDFYNTMAVVHGRNYPDIVENMYNNALKTKALLLSSSIKIRERIMNSEDEELKLLYLTWLNKKEVLSAAIAMSQEQLKEEGLDPGSLAREVEQLEKELSKSSELFKNNTENREIKWEQVKSALKDNEVAVEMLRFRFFDHVLTDSVLYAVLILKNEKKSKPELLVLEDGSALESKYFNYYKNAIKYRIADRHSYERFWRPIEEKVGKSATIYFSADGVFNQINLEAVPIDKSKYVLDQSNIILVSNTKDLFLRKTTTRIQNDEKTALLFGNPKFYLASTENYISHFRSGGTKISDLPGTAEEVEELKKLLSNNGWEINKFTRTDASEEEVKLINSPKVFHIATHGFFTPEDQFQKSAGVIDLKDNASLNNPLLRTGLMLTGAGDLLVETKFNFNQSPGILTAYEAMNLDLDKTELVVLSACETGVGEVQAGEGVFGLQRSFLVAGAKTLIMSLFKVSDEATTKLMISFYEKWLDHGDKRKAFVDAKKEIRNEYKDPIYWGAFIMIGLD